MKRFSYILFLFTLLIRSAFSSEPIKLDAEIFLFQGTQFYTFNLEYQDNRRAIGEAKILQDFSQITPLKMFYIGEPEDTIFSLQAAALGRRTEVVTFTAKNSESEDNFLTCQFNVEFRENLYWLTQEYQCDLDIQVEITNDNQDLD